MSLLLTDIKCLYGLRVGKTPLVGRALAQLEQLEDAYVFIEDGLVVAVGRMAELPMRYARLPKEAVVSLVGRSVLPAFCDSHTHLVYASSREAEFVARLEGQSYAAIAAAGGGIQHSAARVAATSEDQLFERSWKRLQQAIFFGTGAIEIKTGYGLVPAEERKLLRVAARLRAKAPIPVRITYLALHALPLAYADRREAYVQQVAEELIPWVEASRAADYVDAFCEQGFFTAEECRTVLSAAAAQGLRLKLHSEQLSACGGLEVALSFRARSVDHLERLRAEDVPRLAASETFATLLPTAAFFLREPYPPARALIDAGARVALASDHNPGSSPGLNLQFVWALACTAMCMRPEEALQALTFNGAAAMDCADVVGSLAPGKLANLLVTAPIPSLAYVPYSFSHPLMDGVMIRGDWWRRPATEAVFHDLA